ncbi:MAG: hypothetical protein ISS34_08060 [Candidatus Omnitrophica bacterium]|nr:hypothetical protein [Candidatus Omnitrophota bacterium]
MKTIHLRLTIFIFIMPLLLFIKPAAAKENPSLDLSKVTIPKEYGAIKEVYMAPGGKDSKIIFHVQDIHANYEAQRNLANILEYLIRTYGIEVVLVEGGVTDKDFSYIRDWAPIDERKEKADKLLREGVISGETYVDIATDFPLKFQGIEDKELYEENMQIYLKVGNFREEALKAIEGFKKTIEKLKKYIYTTDLNKFDKYKDFYKTEETKLIEYLEYLSNIAEKEDIDLTDYPNHLILTKTARLEKAIDFDTVEIERDNLIKRLDSLLPKEKMSELVIRSIDFKEDKISAAEFYSYLKDLSLDSSVDMDEYKNLKTYVEYIRSLEELESKELFEEINKIEDIVSGVLCKNKQQKELFMVSKSLSTLESFLMLKLAPEDFDYYKENKKDFLLKEWKSFLRKQSKRFDIAPTIPDDTSIITENLSILESFYETAFKRDDAFLRNSLKKMDKEGEKIAFLITGGFHTKNLKRLFMADKISFLIITPRLTQETDYQLYDRILKESYKTRIWDE